MGNYAAFGFGNPRFGNWATHGLGLTTFVPPPLEPTFPPLRTFIVVGDAAIPVIRDASCAVGRLDAIMVPREVSAQVAIDGDAIVVPGPDCVVARPVDSKVKADGVHRIPRSDVIRVARPRSSKVKRED